MRSTFRSEAASLPGSHNVSGIAINAVGALIEKALVADTREQLTFVCRAIDRILRSGHYWVPMWNKPNHLVLPTSDRMFPDGPGSDVVNSYCLVCHSAAMLLSQPAMTRSAWEAEVQKMRTAYKAPIPEEQIQTIVSYLAGLQNAK